MQAARIGALYEVNATTLSQRLVGKTRDYAMAAREKQLFTVGEGKAIEEYIRTIANCRFALTHKLLRQIAKDMLNLRGIQSTNKPEGSVNIPSSSPHIVGKQWVDCFIDRNEGFKRKYIRY